MLKLSIKCLRNGFNYFNNLDTLFQSHQETPFLWNQLLKMLKLPYNLMF